MGRQNQFLSNYDWFYDHYYTQGLTLKAIAKKANCCVESVCNWRVKHNIPKRGYSTQSREAMSRKKKAYLSDPKNLLDMQERQKKYWADSKHREEQSIRMQALYKERPDIITRMAESLRQRSMDPEFRAANSARVSSLWANGVYDDRAAPARSVATSIEVAMRQALDIMKIQYEEQWSPTGYRCRYDFLIPYYKTLVETHGNYWHDYLLFPERRRGDLEKMNWAYEHGYYLLPVWESQLIQCGESIGNMTAVAENIISCWIRCVI